MRSGILPLVPRIARKTTGGYVYHVLNRGVARMQLFDDNGDYLAFVKVLGQGLEKYADARLLSFCMSKWRPYVHCITKGRPYGSTAWVHRIEDRLGLTASLRGRGRPRKPD